MNCFAAPTFRLFVSCSSLFYRVRNLVPIWPTCTHLRLNRPLVCLHPQHAAIRLRIHVAESVKPSFRVELLKSEFGFDYRNNSNFTFIYIFVA
jgi:hypothetical protein